MSRLFPHRRSARGQALVEFALVLPIFAILLFGIIDFGRYVFTANALNNSAREGARFASVSVFPSECSGLTRVACATTIAQTHAWGVAGPISVTVSCQRYEPDGDPRSPAPTGPGGRCRSPSASSPAEVTWEENR